MKSKFKYLSFLIMAIVIFAFMYVFFTNVYPLIIYDADDWTYIAAPRSFIPLIHAWNPARVLPETLMPMCGSIAAYIIYPITHNYLNSLTIVNAFMVALFISLYIYFFTKMLSQVFSLKNISAVLISILFLLFHFIIFLAALENNQHMFLAQNVTCYFFYLIPNLLNFILVFMFMGNKINYSLDFSNPLKLGVLLLAIYAAIFSNLYCSIVLASFAGSQILINFFQEIKTKFNLPEFIKKYFLLWGIIGSFIISALFELTGGRAGFGVQDNFWGSLKTAFLNLKASFFSVNKKVFFFFALITLIFIIVFIYDILKKKDIKKYRNLFLSVIICIIVLAFYFILLSAKVNASYTSHIQYTYGLWANILLLEFLMLSYLIKRFPKTMVLFPLGLCLFLVEFNNSIKTFTENNSYVIEAIGNDIIEQITSSEKNGEKIIYLHVPKYDNSDNWPHAIYLGERISETLYRHNITKNKLDIKIVPDVKYNAKYNI